MLYTNFAIIIFLSLKCVTIFVSMELLIGNLKALTLETEGGERSDRKEYLHNGGVA